METMTPVRQDPAPSETAATPRGVPAYAWGYNVRAGLGLGHTARVLTPTPLRLPKGTVDVQGGVNFSIALTRGGKLYAWGGNQYGQLGDGTTSVRWVPTRVALPKGTTISSIAVGADHVVATTRSGRVFTWGRNHRGQLGDGSLVDRHRPVSVRKGLSGSAVAVAAGNGISAVVTSAGAVFLWGRNTYGQLGRRAGRDPVLGAVTQTRPARAQLPRGTSALAVAAGNRHVTVALRDGRLAMFGLDAQGRPSSGTIAVKSAWGRPVRLAAGEDFTLVLTSRHQLLSFGANASGQLGVGDRLNRLQPALVTLPSARGHVRDIGATARGGVALTSAGELFSWGDGNVGQHGGGRDVAALAVRPTPARVEALSGARIAGLHVAEHHAFVRVESGPAVALRVTPVRTAVAPGVPVSYSVHTVDAFGHDLGPATRVDIAVTDGTVTGQTVSARTPGHHRVTARSGRLTGSALLTVRKGTRR